MSTTAGSSAGSSDHAPPAALILSVAPIDVQVQDTYYVVAHFPHFLSVLAAG
jgi:hypothetical protein